MPASSCNSGWRNTLSPSELRAAWSRHISTQLVTNCQWQWMLCSTTLTPLPDHKASNIDDSTKWPTSFLTTEKLFLDIFNYSYMEYTELRKPKTNLTLGSQPDHKSRGQPWDIERCYFVSVLSFLPHFAAKANRIHFKIKVILQNGNKFTSNVDCRPETCLRLFFGTQVTRSCEETHPYCRHCHGANRSIY